MNKIILLLILSINLFMGSLFASPINDIDEDPWLRTWLFVGPFDNYEMAEKVSDSLWDSSFDEIIEYSNDFNCWKIYSINKDVYYGVNLYGIILSTATRPLYDCPESKSIWSIMIASYNYIRDIIYVYDVSNKINEIEMIELNINK